MKVIKGPKKNEVYIFNENRMGIYFSKRDNTPFNYKRVSVMNVQDGKDQDSERKVIFVYPVGTNCGMRVYTWKRISHPYPAIQINREVYFHCNRKKEE